MIKLSYSMAYDGQKLKHSYLCLLKYILTVTVKLLQFNERIGLLFYLRWLQSFVTSVTAFCLFLYKLGFPN